MLLDFFAKSATFTAAHVDLALVGFVWQNNKHCFIFHI